MNKQDRSAFENAWQEAFEGAEMAPSDQLWGKIELDLTKQANSGYKKRILFFKLMAAASVLFAAVIGGYTVLNNSDHLKVESREGHSITSHDATNTSDVDQLYAENTEKQDKAEVADHTHSATYAKESENVTRIAKSDSKSGDKISQTVAKAKANNMLIREDKMNDNTAAFHTVKNDNMTQHISQSKKGEEGSISDPNLVEKLNVAEAELGELLAMDMQYVPRLTELHKRKKTDRDLWVGIGLAMGQNSTSSAGGEPMAFENLNSDFNNVQRDQINLSEERSGRVVSAGLAVGKQVARRWIVESGLSYIKRSTLAESNLAMASPQGVQAANNVALAESTGQVYLTDVYQLRNTYNSISVPLQAGYLLIDRQIGVTLKAGLANDILLFNRVEDTSGNLEAVTVNAGADSQYNTYLISGLLTSEFSYLLGQHYYLALTPQLRKSINSVTKDEAGEANKPIIFTVGFKLNYLFK